MATETFEALKVVKRQIQDLNRSCYRVYKTVQEFVTVEAATALEAIQESGVQSPLKVERVLQFEDRLLDQQRLRPEKDEIAFPVGEDVEVAELAQTQVRAEKQADKESGFSEIPFRTGDMDSVMNPEAPEGEVEEALTPLDDEALMPFFSADNESGEPAGVVAISGLDDVPAGHIPSQEVEDVETLSEEDVAALLSEKPE